MASGRQIIIDSSPTLSMDPEHQHIVSFKAFKRFRASWSESITQIEKAQPWQKDWVNFCAKKKKKKLFKLQPHPRLSLLSTPPPSGIGSLPTCWGVMATWCDAIQWGKCVNSVNLRREQSLSICVDRLSAFEMLCHNPHDKHAPVHIPKKSHATPQNHQKTGRHRPLAGPDLDCTEVEVWQTQQAS